MGGDGGTHANMRRYVVALKKDKQKLSKEDERRIRWFLCALTAEPLRAPVVTCKLGRLYNKESIVQALVHKKLKRLAVFSHIRKLKDVRELKIHRIEASSAGASTASATDEETAEMVQRGRWACPVTLAEANGSVPFVVLWTCGHLVSQKAIDMLRDQKCPVCAAEYQKADIVRLNPPEDEVEAKRKALLAERQALRKEMPGEEEPGNKTVIAEPYAGKDAPAAHERSAVEPRAKRHRSEGSAKDSLASSILAAAASKHKEKQSSETYRSLFTSSGSKGAANESLGKSWLAQGANRMRM